jgi:transposase-like protein
MDEAVRVKHRLRIRPIQPPSSAFAGFRFPPEVILIAVRCYLRYGLSYRDLEELLAERGIEVDHVTLFRWVQRFTPILVEAAKPCRHSVGGHWFVDETYVKVSGSWRYVYRAVDQYGQVIDVLLSKKRDLRAATTFFATAIRSHGAPAEVTTDRAHALGRVVADLLPAALHDTTQYANNRVEATNLPYPGPGRVCRTTSDCHARQALMSTAMTGPGGGSRRYCSYFAASSESARLCSAPGPMMRAMPSTRIHHSADQSST